jgi:hypothetical protein
MQGTTAFIEGVRSGSRVVKKTKAKQPARRKAGLEQDRLITQLHDTEAALQEWIDRSPDNLDFFRRDPIRAMRAAGLEIDDDIMLELELITRAIARKLK